MRPLPTKIGLPRLDNASWDKGFFDGFRGSVWWPGAGIEPLYYAAGYTEAQAGRDKAEPSPPQSGASGGIRGMTLGAKYRALVVGLRTWGHPFNKIEHQARFRHAKSRDIVESNDVNRKREQTNQEYR